MNNRDIFWGTRKVMPLASTAISTATVTNSAAISTLNVAAFAVFLDCLVRTNGSVAIQDVQFANDSSFTENVTTYDMTSISTFTNVNANDTLLKNDRNNYETGPLSQTTLSAVGSRKIAFENKSVNGQKFMRVRLVTTGGTVAVTVKLEVLQHENNQPVVQA